MHRWNEIEQAAADRHAHDLRAGKEAQRLRAVRDEQPSQGWLARLLDRRTQRHASADVQTRADVGADVPAEAH
jgi:hypothetical protein